MQILLVEVCDVIDIVTEKKGIDKCYTMQND